jgi:hypothetical protein
MLHIWCHNKPTWIPKYCVIIQGMYHTKVVALCIMYDFGFEVMNVEMCLFEVCYAPFRSLLWLLLQFPEHIGHTVVWQNVSGGHFEINVLSWIIEKFRSSCVCIFLFQYIDNETLEKLCWTKCVSFVSSSKHFCHENTYSEFCRRWMQVKGPVQYL